MGRPRITDVTKRQWFREYVRQTPVAEDSKYESDWDHLLWIGDGINRFSAPKVNSAFGVRNVRRVMWAEVARGLPPLDMEVIPQCDEDRCISPRHAELIDRSEAASARYRIREEMEDNPEATRRGKPWLRAAKTGTAWADFTSPYGQAAASTAYSVMCHLTRFGEIAGSQMLLEVENMVALDVVKLEGPVRAVVQLNWGEDQFADAMIDVFNLKWLSFTLGSSPKKLWKTLESANERLGDPAANKRHFTLWNSDEGDEWEIEDVPESRFKAVITEPGSKG